MPVTTTYNDADALACRICLDGPYQGKSLYRRCNCAYYHDQCFKEWLFRRNSEVCEVCNQRYIGVYRYNKTEVVANLQRQAWLWLGIYSVIIILIWILKGLIEEYSNCVYRARENGGPITQCEGWNTIEEMLIVICGVSTAAIMIHAGCACACPGEAGLIVSHTTSKIVMVPAQGTEYSDVINSILDV